ncbi:MAG: S1 RNA-binding domain-containing protein [Candidatus Bipolaricaulota bacterium]|nr:S1 RNA-binding domain-containing protein [Candidatus Bipolaricaulota bacterium]
MGDIIEGTVENTTEYGAFVELTSEVTGLIHISALSDDYVRRVEDVLKSGDKVTVEVLNIDDRGRYKLRRIVPETEKKAPQEQKKEKEKHFEGHDFEVEKEKVETEKKVPREQEKPEFEDRW